MANLLPCPCGSTNIDGMAKEAAWCWDCGLTFDIQGYMPDGVPKAHHAWNRHSKAFYDLKTPTSKPLTYGELKPGDRFIAFPTDGDDAGHGGYRLGSYLFVKRNDTVAIRLVDGQESSHTEYTKNMKVLLILT